MPNQRFNHDYRHCEGVGCVQRGDCAFYLALLEAMNIDLKNSTIIDRCVDGGLYLRVRIEEGGER